MPQFDCKLDDRPGPPISSSSSSSSLVTFDSLVVAQIGNSIFSELASSAWQNLEVLVSSASNQ